MATTHGCYCAPRYKDKGRCLGQWLKIGDWSGSRPCPSSCHCGKEATVYLVGLGGKGLGACDEHKKGGK